VKLSRIAEFAPATITDENTGDGRASLSARGFPALTGQGEPASSASGKDNIPLGRAHRPGDEGSAVATAEVWVTAEPRSAGVARRFLRQTLNDWDASAYADVAELVLTELVTNAILHAKTDIVVRIDLGVRGLRLEVMDRSPRQPITRHYSLDATTGRGLGLVDALTQRWGVQPDVEGKTVWAELAFGPPVRQAIPEMADTDVHSLSDAPDDIAERASGFGPSDQWAQAVSAQTA
jgi:anti-sigma regulatory factor (Ser/Thr protein kinase)